MGGKLFGDLSRRYSKDEYNDAKDALFEKLRELLGDEHLFADTVSLIDKVDFGDMDIIITKNNDAARKIFNAQSKLGLRNDDLLHESVEADIEKDYPIYQNSYLFGDLHVDFIFVNEDSYESSCNYTAYNDLGNFIGKLARELGVRFSYHGLEYDVYDGSDFAGKINLTKDMKKILEVLDLSWDKYQEGFRNREDQAEFIVRSQFFNRDKFFTNLKSRDRTRIRKRDSFKTIKDIVEARSDIGLIEHSDEYKKRHIVSHFPDFDNQVLRCILDFRQKREEARRLKEEVKKKFSNKLVSEYTGMHISEVPQLMEFMSLRLQDDIGLDLKKFIHQTDKTKDELRDWVLDEYAEYKRQKYVPSKGAKP